MNHLEVQRISYAYDKQVVLKDLSLAVEQGEVACLLGPSGCGKSTLLRLIAGLDRLQVGKITIGKKIVATKGKFIEPEQRSVGLVFQNPSLFPHITVIENVAFGLTGLSKQKKQQRAMERLEAVGLTSFANKYSHELSGGEQQRVALARALALEPSVMLLDEPFANLDVVLRKGIREDTLRLLKSQNIATLLVTHDPEEALGMADRIHVMQACGIVQSGSAQDLYTKPASSFVAHFFGELNEVEGEVDKGKISTPLGNINSTRKDIGRHVTAYIRPEGLSFTKKKAGAPEGKVKEVRFLGESSIVLVKLQNSDIPLRVRVLGVDVPKKGQAVHLAVDKKQVFIFD